MATIGMSSFYDVETKTKSEMRNTMEARNATTMPLILLLKPCEVKVCSHE